MGGFRTAGTALLIAAVGALLATAPATSATADSEPAGTIGSFPAWTVEPATAPLAHQGSATFSAATGFPAVSFTTDSTTATSPSGASAFLGASTGFGQHFGSSRLQPYLNLAPAAGGHVSTTTVTFAGPPPAGWGFAVGDIDADFLEIIPSGTGGTLAGSDLGAQDTGGTPPLNYCNNSPKPSSCAGSGPFTDTPSWFENGTTVGATTYTTPIVLGHGTDTSGSYDWFLPDTAVRSITFHYHVLSGSPIFQLWLAALAPQTVISGTIDPPAGDQVPTGTTADLESAGGAPILGIEGEPVDVPVAPNGDFTIVAEEQTYDLAFTVPAGFDPIPTERIDATSGAVTLDPVALRVLLATTGVDVAAPMAAGLAAAIVGSAMLALARRRRRAISR